MYDEEETAAPYLIYLLLGWFISVVLVIWFQPDWGKTVHGKDDQGKCYLIHTGSDVYDVTEVTCKTEDPDAG